MPPTDPDEQMLRIIRSARDGSPAASADGDAPDLVLGRIGRALRSGPPSSSLDPDVPPPPGLWSAIAARLDEPAVLPSPAPVASQAPVAAPAAEPTEPLAPVIPLSSRARPSRASRVRRRPIGLLIGSAAAAAVVVAGIGGVIGRGSGGSADVVAEVALDRLEGVDLGADVGPGKAALERTSDGRVVLRLSSVALPAEDGAYYELWLIAPDITRMVSLGPVNSSGIYEVPAGIDPADYPVVDVSIEPADGTPTHSGRSVLRGTLQV